MVTRRPHQSRYDRIEHICLSVTSLFPLWHTERHFHRTCRAGDSLDALKATTVRVVASDAERRGCFLQPLDDAADDSTLIPRWHRHEVTTIEHNHRTRPPLHTGFEHPVIAMRKKITQSGSRNSDAIKAS
jgi:hypothetical protein